MEIKILITSTFIGKKYIIVIEISRNIKHSVVNY